METSHDKDLLKAALAYSRYLAMTEHIRWMNERRAEVGEPPESVPLLLNTVGKAVYERIRDDLREQRGGHAGVLLKDGERRAVIDAIARQLYRGR